VYDLYGPVCTVMFLMRADPLRGQAGGGWALEIDTFLGPVKWHRAVWRVPFGAQKSRCVLRKNSFHKLHRLKHYFLSTSVGETCKYSMQFFLYFSGREP
jgi:hypothetical protein